MKVYTRKGDDGTTGLLYGGRIPKDAPGPDRLRHRRTKRSPRSGSPAPRPSRRELHELLIRLQRSCSSSARSSRPRPRTGASSRRAPRCDRRDGRRRSSRSSTTSPRASIRRPSSCCPARTAFAAALDLARTIVRRAEREAVTATTRGWLEPESRSCRTSTGSPTCAGRSPAGRRASSARPGPRAPRPPEPAHRPRRLAVPLTFSSRPPPRTRSRPTSSRCRSSRPATSAPARDAVDGRSAAGSTRSWRRPASRASRARRWQCRQRRARREGRDARRRGRRAELTLDGVRNAARRDRPQGQEGRSRSRRRCSTPRRRSSTPARRAGASPRASRSASYQYLEYKSDGKPTKLDRGDGDRQGRRARSSTASTAAARRARRRSGPATLVNTPARHEVARRVRGGRADAAARQGHEGRGAGRARALEAGTPRWRHRRRPGLGAVRRGW